MKADKKIHIDCACGCAAMRIFHWEDEELVYVHVFHDYKSSFWNRLKNLFKPKNSMIELVLDQNDSYRIAKFLREKDVVE
jgi:hypothetical protein